MTAARTIPRATARLQLHQAFTLDDAAAVVPYLARLGVSHLYSSPLLTARPGSTHGYDIVDHRHINPELGGEPALDRLVAVLRAHGMALLMDIVPNHMGVGGADNAWWLDVLEWGRASPYAEYFDIDWEPADATLHNRLQAPFLGAPYGECLANGDLKLAFDAATGGLAVAYGEHVFPIEPRHYRMVLGDIAGTLMEGLSPMQARAQARAAAAAMRAKLRGIATSESGAANIARALARFNATTQPGREALHHLLERQHYRLVWWRAAADEINWRRFFDVTSLAGIRAEVPVVFDDTHELIIRLYAQGKIDGVRIDHVDGLADPRAYCRKLRRKLETAGRERPPEAPVGPPYIVVEKILAGAERLPDDWRTDGTTGYDFMDQVSALLHDPAGEAPLTALWTELTGRPAAFPEEELEARRLILRDALASELNGTAAALHRVARRDLATRDYTLTAIRRALTEILAHFPVYRLYAGLAGRAPADDQVLARAMAGAKRMIRAADHPLLDLIGSWLGGEAPRQVSAGPLRRERLRAIVRFEQLSSPVAAKSMEDTAFYRYGRLLSRNEVGSNPGQLALGPGGFHAACAARLKHFPHALLATATHDHKRGEDTRARLAVLSEIPDEWAGALRRWMRLHAPLRRELAGTAAPDAADEIMLYQMIVGAWPLDLAAADGPGVAAFVERLSQWQEKALREAKRHSGWVAPDQAYEGACRHFLERVLDPERAARGVGEFAAFADRLARAGVINSLAQTTLRLTAPGVPDLYQGADLWDFSLVDPDNRRPVDYETRRRALAAGLSPAEAFADWRSGVVKQAIIARTGALRDAMPALFAEGRYVPIAAAGPAADQVFSFGRQHGASRLLVAVTRLAAGRLGQAACPLLSPEAWGETTLELPAGWSRSGRDVLTGAAGTPKVANLLCQLPVAVIQLD